MSPLFVESTRQRGKREGGKKKEEKRRRKGIRAPPREGPGIMTRLYFSLLWRLTLHGFPDRASRGEGGEGREGRSIQSAAPLTRGSDEASTISVAASPSASPGFLR